ncbi:MAG: hypothetical protein K6G88_11040 [Lachnospiraceae bacterium]|nr:hypothetical protein [Lachnospiraceae bacterium]
MGKKIAKIAVVTCLILVVGVVFVMGQINKAKEKKEVKNSKETETKIGFDEYPSVEINEDTDGEYNEIPEVEFRYEDSLGVIKSSLAQSHYYYSDVGAASDDLADHLLYGYMELLASGNYSELYNRTPMEEAYDEGRYTYYCDQLKFHDFINEWENAYGDTEGEWYMTIDHVHESRDITVFDMTVGKVKDDKYINLNYLSVSGYYEGGEYHYILGDVWEGRLFGNVQLARYIK